MTRIFAYKPRPPGRASLPGAEDNRDLNSSPESSPAARARAQRANRADHSRNDDFFKFNLKMFNGPGRQQVGPCLRPGLILEARLGPGRAAGDSDSDSEAGRRRRRRAGGAAREAKRGLCRLRGLGPAPPGDFLPHIGVFTGTEDPDDY